MRRLLSALALVAMSAGFAPAAQAGALGVCSVFDVWTIDAGGNKNSLECGGAYSQTGQPSDAEIIIKLDLLENLNWSQVNSALTVTGIGATSGTWAISPNSADYLYALVLKSANDWAVYTLNTPPWNGGWNSVGTLLTPNDRNNAALSNMQVFRGLKTGGEGPPPRIPEPGVLALLGAGLAGFALVRRRRRA